MNENIIKLFMKSKYEILAAKRSFNLKIMKNRKLNKDIKIREKEKTKKRFKHCQNN